ncbi:MAG TPA: sensor domain-containing protein [Candidatus Limnocylindrales bacterium]|nr:sensor domain-containing protein [Candidatus Limnocylindrales bacterium]
MIGVPILLVGLLLATAAFVPKRIPGGAFSPSGIDRSRAFIVSPIHPATWYANGAVVLGLFIGLFAFAAVAAIASAGLTVLLAGIGIVLVGVAIELARLFARVERWRAFAGEPVRPRPHAYRPLSGVGFVGLLKGLFADESRWRDVLYVAINLPLSFIEFGVVAVLWFASLALLTVSLWLAPGPGSLVPVVAGTAAGLVLLPVAASLSQLVMALQRSVVGGLLCTSEARELRRQVEVLRESRSAVLDSEASELHRIERDLHDGAQQRLVMLSIDLGLASERIDTDPAAAKELILEGQEQARAALAEIRDLVRGIAPSILLDRGLVAALESIAGRGPVPTSIRSDLAPGERLPVAAERAAYFVAAEALANVAKHSGATRCEVLVSTSTSRLVIEVRDDGVGGASTTAGGGLSGLAGRVAGVDGTFSVSSPHGGPTIVRAEIPLGAATPEPAAGTPLWDPPAGDASAPDPAAPSAPGPAAAPAPPAAAPAPAPQDPR